MGFRSLLPRQFKLLYWDYLGWRRNLRLLKIGREFIRRHGEAVLGGPFKGMRYVPEAFSPNSVARLLGSYEEELHGAIESAISRRPAVVVDVGCAEGYYAVGLASRLSGAIVFAYDTETAKQDLCKAMATANEVSDRVKVGGAVTPELLSELPLVGALVFSDCEGYEAELLDPTRCPNLLAADIVVELHEHLTPGVTDLVCSRFAATHQCELIHTRRHNPEKYPALNWLSKADRQRAADDARGIRMAWAVLTRRGLTS
jgi:hypothetical protein